MDRPQLDRVCEELASKGVLLEDIEAELADIRSRHSIVEAIYILSKVFDLSLAEAKRMVIAYEYRQGGRWVDDFQNRLHGNI